MKFKSDEEELEYLNKLINSAEKKLDELLKGIEKTKTSGFNIFNYELPSTYEASISDSNLKEILKHKQISSQAKPKP